MQLSSIQAQHTVSHGIEEKGTFKIQESAKAFNVLIDKLYTNKILAVIRELSTNAYEAHQMVNKEKEPFSVTLPNHYNKNFIVRDYGPGLSHEDATNLYVTLFASSKDGSNVYGGAFGLGSKSPFAYTNQFSVTSYHKGKKRIYLISKNDYGQPEWSLASESDTTETGVEIKVPVQDRDIGLFKQNAEAVYTHFMTRPTISGQSLVLKDLTPSVSGTNWKIIKSHGYDPAVAVMGNIAYPLHGYTGKNSNLINHAGLILHFNIGDLEPTPSREALSFNKHTTLKIEKALEVLIDEYSKNAQTEVDKEICMYDAIIKYNQLKSASTIPLRCTYKGKTLKLTLPKDLEYYQITATRKHLCKQSYDTDWNPRAQQIFYIADECTYSQQRLKLALGNSYNTTWGVADDVKKIKEFCTALGIPESRLVRISSLPKPTINRAPKGPGNAHKSKVHEFQYGMGSNFSSWKDVNIDLSKETGYYTLIYNNRIKLDTKEYIDPHKFGRIVKEVFGKDIPFFGVKEAQSAKIGTGLKDLIQEVKNKAQSIISKYNDSFDARTTLEELGNYWYFTGNLITLDKNRIPQDLKDLKEKYEKLASLEKDWYSQHQTVSGLSKIVQSNHVPVKDSKFIQEFKNLVKKYLLLNKMNIDHKDVKDELYFYISKK